jgi:competence protein ComEC
MKPHEIGFWGGLSVIAGITASMLSVSIHMFGAFLLLACVSFWMYRSILFAGLMGALLFFGCFYGHFYTIWHTPVFPVGEYGVFEGRVRSIPTSDAEGQKGTVVLLDPHKGDVTVYVDLYPELHYGDMVAFEGVIKRSSYGDGYWIAPDSVEITERYAGIGAMLLSIRAYVSSSVQKVLPYEHAALMNGILLGERAAFSDRFYDALVSSGTVHIVALSGYNITIIAVATITALSFCMNRKRALLIAIVFVIAFVFMTGAEESIVRAAIMGILVLLAERFGKIYSFRNACVLTAAGMLVYDPTLITSAGFQLSFMALLGLVYGEPFLQRVFAVTEGGFLNWKRNLLQTSAAQIAVLPVILFHFGSASLIAVIPNMLILEMIPITMFLGSLIAIVSVISYHFSIVIGWIAYLFLSYEISVITFFGM